ncbi:hypothetical protein GDO81_022414 [Engystomops pustulosus]|uniref:Uncharacterized protein n=1 Tax=Engystomops pustulosus TaxID=76066 RepID=A0AAV6Z4H9_ENGPU|nr:hypothetical protein GDO81_022414 [Engystomops pustulosus]
MEDPEKLKKIVKMLCLYKDEQSTTNTDISNEFTSSLKTFLVDELKCAEADINHIFWNSDGAENNEDEVWEAWWPTVKALGLNQASINAKCELPKKLKLNCVDNFVKERSPTEIIYCEIAQSHPDLKVIKRALENVKCPAAKDLDVNELENVTDQVKKCVTESVTEALQDVLNDERIKQYLSPVMCPPKKGKGNKKKGV